MVNDADRRFQWVLAGLFLLLFVLLGIAPKDRHDWFMENALVFLLLLALAAGHRQVRFSNSSAVLIVLFLCIHEVGAHYTYSLVPYDEWSQKLGGGGLNALLGWRRNNFDRLVHFSYGLLLVYPIREVLMRLTPLRGFWASFLALDLVVSTSTLYELIEWIGGEYVGGDKAAVFIALQNDKWDPQKDIALAMLGAILALAVVLLLERTGVPRLNPPGQETSP
ncbi:Inner membrane protein YjdF [compost metagenome]